MYSAVLLLFVMPVVADDTKIAIFVPKAQEPYKSIYKEIVLGARNAANAANTGIIFEQFLLDKNSNSQDINKYLETKNIVNIIVLGRIGWRLAKQLSKLTLPLQLTDGSSSTKKKYSIVSGALPISPNGLSGVSLITDPSHLFSYLDQVAPQVKNIHVAYSVNNQWLIELAQTAAKSQGLKFTPTKVQTTKEAIEFYQTLLTSSVSEEDALWLPLDKITSHDKITLPMILEKAWAKEVVVFSSKPSHAKRGVLFSTYPDNFLLGKHLFSMSQSLVKDPQQKQFSALQSTWLAVNLRTAAHLGLKYSTKQQQQFKLTFPE